MLNSEFPPLGGGMGIVNHELLHRFAAHDDIWIDLVTSTTDSRRLRKEEFSPRITLFKLPIRNRNPHHFRKRELLQYGWSALSMATRLAAKQSYDLSFAFSALPAGAVSYLLHRRCGVPYLVSLQGADGPEYEPRLFLALGPVLRLVWRHAAVVTATSEGHRSMALRTMPDCTIKVINNGVDPTTFAPCEKPSRGLPAKVLCVARLTERKGQHHLLRAFATIQSAAASSHLTLVGTGDAEQSLRAMASALGIADRVTFMGRVPHDQMPTLYRESDIFVLPSRSEGMSLALLEALASGLPAIVTDTGGTSELMRDGVGGYIVRWGDVAGLSSALERLVGDERMREEMAKANRSLARSHSWDTFAFDYLEICRRIGRDSRSGSSGNKHSRQNQ